MKRSTTTQRPGKPRQPASVRLLQRFDSPEFRQALEEAREEARREREDSAASPRPLPTPPAMTQAREITASEPVAREAQRIMRGE